MQRQKKDHSLSTTAISAVSGPEALFSPCPSGPTIPIHTNFCGLLSGLLADFHSLTPTEKCSDTCDSQEDYCYESVTSGTCVTLNGLIVTAQMCDLVTA